VRQRATTAAAIVTVPVLVAVLAFINQGFPLAKLDLNDGAVWVTATSQLKLGRYNVPVQELNAGLVAQGSTFDVLQDAQDVVLKQPDGFAVVDPTGVTAGPTVPAPGADVSMAAGIVSVVGAQGGLYVRPIGSVEGLRVGTDAPDADLSADGLAVVAQDGTVLAVDDDGSVTKVAPGAGPTGSGSLGSGPADALTAVGDVPVVLRGDTVTTPHGDVRIDDTGLVLQQPGPSSSRVLVSSTSALYEVPLDGGDVVKHPTTGNGKPANPVQVGSCAHAAWATATGSYLQLCDGKKAQVENLQDTSAQDELTFRVNRSMVLLNDTLRGRLWSPLEDTNLRTPNWDDIKSPDDPQKDEDDTDSTDTVQDLVTECSAKSSAPTAVDDEFGVRPGRATILPVIDNDSSGDCGVLVISEVDPLPKDFGTVSLVYDGRALQVDVADTATGSASFTYTITDGRGTSAPSTATVHLTTHESSRNDEPEQLRTGSMKVEQGGSSTYQALADFRDPDGDDLVLVGAAADAGAGTVTFKQDGSVTFSADGPKLGRVKVTLQVSDGTSTIEGRLDVDVRSAGSVPPQIDPVFAVAYVGQTITVKPLDAVKSGTDEPVRLSTVGDVPGAVITPDLEAGTFTFQATRAATYYVSFGVTASPQSASGLARIDVREFPTKALPPVAVRDQAFLPAGGEVTIDPLANDSDPAGGVLVLQGVTVPDDNIHVAVLDHHLAQIHADTTLTSAQVLTYTVSNGTATAVGEIVVQPVPPKAEQPPVVAAVEVNVRTGGVVTIPVLDTAYDPDGDQLTLKPDLAESVKDGQGLMFVSGDVLRYQAPSSATTAHAVFTVSDGTYEASAAVTVLVHASSAETKKPPRPQDLTARVFAGSTVRIPITLIGIDDDGDGVTLLGPATAPKLGSIKDVGADYIEYTAPTGAAGTDEFTYAVEDWVGQRATATIRVGISPPPQGAATVVARDDVVEIRPGQSIEVRVLANDVDSSGGELTLSPDLDVQKGITATKAERRIAVVAPKKNGTWQIGYTVTNARGGRDTGNLVVTVDDKAPVLPPLARDVVVPPKDTLGLTEVSVKVLEVAQNPSGPVSDLVVSVPSSVADVARVDAAGNVIVTLVKDAQTVPFLITNKTSPTARSYAFITVPALGFFPPTLRPNAPELRVASGMPLTISLDEYVKVAPGRTASISDTLGVTASNANGDDLVTGPAEVTYTSAKSFAGTASVTIPVTDGVRAAYITLEIEVYAPEDHPPTFQPLTLDVAPGEPAQPVSLPAITLTPEGAVASPRQYSYTITSAVPAGFSATIDKNNNLLVTADKTAPKGKTGTLDLQIGYGKAGKLQTSLALRVIASTRAKAQVLDQRVEDGAEGKQVTLNVLEGARNPFPESPLSVVDAVVETPDAGTVGWTASTVSVRPAVGFIGTMTTRFRVRDVTGDPDRYVEGRITVVVRGKPATPTAPRIGEVRDRTVALSWTAPDSRGTPITGYRVTASPGGRTTSCPATSCTISDLTNDVEYTFKVEAQNAVGWSDPSPASLPARPDAVPDAPAAPTVDFGDGRLDVSWTAPNSTGSPITSYTVELTGGGRVVTATEPTTRHTFTGLTNGVQYTVRLRANNDAKDPSGWSPSTSQTPAGVPDAPDDVAAAPTDTKAGSVLDITWSQPALNGDPIKSYEVTIDGPNGLTVTVDPSSSPHFTFKNAKTKVSYTVTVRAQNKAGWGSKGKTSATTSGLPTAPLSLTPSVVDGEGSVALDWSGADGNGAPITGYRVWVSDGRDPIKATGSSLTVTGLTGGVQYTFDVATVNENGQSLDKASTSATPTTPPTAVRSLTLHDADVDANGQPTSIVADWQAPSSWGGGTDHSYAYRFQVDGSWGDWISTSSTQAKITELPKLVLFDRSFTLAIEVKAVASSGSTSTTSDTRTYSRVTEPDSVRNLAFDAPSPGDTSVTARWSEPNDLGGSSSVTYEYSVGDTDSWVSNGADRSVSLPVDTTNGAVTVRIYVRAVTSGGDGKAKSATVTVQPAPSTPDDPGDSGGGTP